MLSSIGASCAPLDDPGTVCEAFGAKAATFGIEGLAALLPFSFGLKKGFGAMLWLDGVRASEAHLNLDAAAQCTVMEKAAQHFTLEKC